jgi:hypothetical protein
MNTTSEPSVLTDRPTTDLARDLQDRQQEFRFSSDPHGMRYTVAAVAGDRVTLLDEDAEPLTVSRVAFDSMYVVVEAGEVAAA